MNRDGDPESPRTLRSGASVRSALAPLAAVLQSAAVPERAAPFSPTHVAWPVSRHRLMDRPADSGALPAGPPRVGMKGAVGSVNPAPASTAADGAERSRGRGSRAGRGFPSRVTISESPTGAITHP
jgi:hypothetical protein